MTPSELRAAADDVIRTYVTDPEEMGIDIRPTITERKAIAIAQHVLATVRDDDDEPITQEWCELRSNDWRECMGQYINRRNSALIIANGCLCVGGKRTPITTVGQLRGIVTALGIEVTQ